MDSFDYTKGTIALDQKLSGPPVNGTISTLRGVQISSASGIYYEDYFFNATCSKLGPEYLNEFNGTNSSIYIII